MTRNSEKKNLKLIDLYEYSELNKNKLGLSWAKLSSSWDWALLQL